MQRTKLSRHDAARILREQSIIADCIEYDSGEAILSDFAPGTLSLAFLDIYMNGMTGVEAAKRLKAIDPDCAVIFTTTSREHGADAFDLDADRIMLYYKSPSGSKTGFAQI